MSSAAEKYLLSKLSETCQNLLNQLANTNINDYLAVIARLFLYGLKERAVNSLLHIEPSWNAIVKADNFSLLPFKCLELILSSDHLRITEEGIWESCVSWSKYQHQKHNCLNEEGTPGTTPCTVACFVNFAQSQRYFRFGELGRRYSFEFQRGRSPDRKQY